MDKHVVSAVTVLLLLVAAVQAHTQQTTRSSGDSSTVQAPRSGSSSSSRGANIIKNLTLPPRNIELRSPSSVSNFESTTEPAAIAVFSSSSLPEAIVEFVDGLNGTILSTRSSSSDERGVVGDTDRVASSRSNCERVSITITTQMVNVFSKADDDASQSASSNSAGTVQPNNEGTAIESAALEFSTVESTTPDQAADAASSYPSTSTTPTFGKKATSTIGSSIQDQGGNNTVLTTSDSALSSPIFYACVVLGVVGLVGAVVSSRAKGKRDVSDKWLVTTESSTVTPTLAVVRPSAWAPPASEVHVVIDDHRFALL